MQRQKSSVKERHMVAIDQETHEALDLLKGKYLNSPRSWIVKKLVVRELKRVSKGGDKQ